MFAVAGCSRSLGVRDHEVFAVAGRSRSGSHGTRGAPGRPRAVVAYAVYAVVSRQAASHRTGGPQEIREQSSPVRSLPRAPPAPGPPRYPPAPIATGTTRPPKTYIHIVPRWSLWSVAFWPQARVALKKIHDLFSTSLFYVFFLINFMFVCIGGSFLSFFLVS